jgi:hypothetical protein
MPGAEGVARHARTAILVAGEFRVVAESGGVRGMEGVAGLLESEGLGGVHGRGAAGGNEGGGQRCGA